MEVNGQLHDPADMDVLEKRNISCLCRDSNRGFPSHYASQYQLPLPVSCKPQIYGANRMASGIPEVNLGVTASEACSAVWILGNIWLSIMLSVTEFGRSYDVLNAYRL
jgi:hypothetical protein